MTQLNPGVDAYFAVGCGRCPLGGTPACKVHPWQAEMKRLRAIVLDCGLTEEVKWGVPCYTVGNGNVLLLSAFREYCALSFFKGALLRDTAALLQKPGENSQAARVIRFTTVQEIDALEPVLKATIQEAIAVEEAGLKVAFKPVSEFTIPEELQQRLDEDPALQAAFEALTPGRQRGYIIHISGAKQAKTRAARVEKCVPRILSGLGMHDR